METARIYIASDRWQRDAGAEAVLRDSILENASCPVEIHWMRSGEGDFKVSEHGGPDSWKIGRPAGQAWPKRGWGTDFSCFRMAVPHLAGFQGKAIYMDADMLVLGDVAELLELDMPAPIVALDARRTDVAVFDCDRLRGKAWPPLKFMRKSGNRMFEWVQFLHQHGYVSTTLPREWNLCDPRQPTPDPGIPENAKLLHFTTVPTQPWRPYSTVKYSNHPWPSWVEEWNRWHAKVSA